MTETPTKKPGPRKATPDQGSVMQEGRRQAAAVRGYLDALRHENAPRRRGRKRTIETVQRRLKEIDVELDSGIDALKELLLIQEKMDLAAEAKRMTAPRPNPAEYEGRFIEVAKRYGDRQGISVAAWKQLGVPASVLKKAKIS